MMRKTLFALVAVAVINGTLAHAAVGTERDSELDYAAMAEDIEIMQRILGKALQDHFNAKKLDSDEAALEALPVIANVIGKVEGSVLESSVMTRQYALGINDYLRYLPRHQIALSAATLPSNFNIEGFYVPGTGVMYTIKFSTQLKKETLVEDEDRESEDLWNAVKTEIRGDHPRVVWNIGSTSTRTRYVLDEDDLDRTVEVLLKTVGDYGSKMTQLTSNESIFLVANVEGRIPSSWIVPYVVTDIPAALLTSRAHMAKYHLIIRIPVGAIRDYDSGAIDLTTLKNKSEVTRYEVNASDSCKPSAVADAKH
ncbi:MAG: hypothetical protein JSU63_21250 [Phycisphaerales bacterium]|nr:MAG: hypothetical protein JSU63_21250 [Phycisphaerales bacterium]